MRDRLLRYFEWEGTADAGELADEALTRLARRLAAGEAVQSLPSYAGGIARLLALEHKREVRRREPALPINSAAIHPAEPDTVNPQTERCLEQCLEELAPESRSLILRYYDGDAGARIRNRNKLARELGISLNSLRNRALRLRDRLEKSLNDCLGETDRG